jgi:hypothetical protein
MSSPHVDLILRGISRVWRESSNEFDYLGRRHLAWPQMNLARRCTIEVEADDVAAAEFTGKQLSPPDPTDLSTITP